jgi:predicted DNA-binding WGR domain protein
MIFPQCDRERRVQMAKKHWPRGAAFGDAEEALLRSGWPRLRVLVDGHPGDKKPAAFAQKVIDDIDPVVPVYWPRAASVRYLRALVAPDAKDAAARAETTPVDVALADRIIPGTALCTYPFRYDDGLFLLEAHLGAEVMAERVLGYLETVPAKLWKEANLNFNPVRSIHALECFILRSDKKSAEESCRRLKALAKARPARGSFGWRLAMTVAGTPAVRANLDNFTYDHPFLTVDAEYVAEYLRHEYAAWRLDPQHLFLFGDGVVPRGELPKMRSGPSWKLVRRVVELGILRSEVVVEIMAHMVGSRAAKGKPEEWLAAHAEFARPTLGRLVAAGGAVGDALAALAGPSAAGAKKPPRMLSGGELDRRMGALFKEAVAAVKKVRGDAAAEHRAWAKAALDAAELRAGAGDIAPDEKLGHIFGVDGWGKFDPPFQTLGASEAETDRWFAAITDPHAAPPSSPPPANPPRSTAKGERLFQLVAGTSKKFWAIAIEGRSHTVRFGRIGTAGQSKTKQFPDAESARSDGEKLVREKLGKGYRELKA